MVINHTTTHDNAECKGTRDSVLSRVVYSEDMSTKLSYSHQSGPACLHTSSRKQKIHFVLFTVSNVNDSNCNVAYRCSTSTSLAQSVCPHTVQQKVHIPVLDSKVAYCDYFISVSASGEK